MAGEDLGISQDKSTWESVKPLVAMAAMAYGGDWLSGLGGGPEALGELGGYGFTSTEVAGAAPTLLGEAGLEAAAAGAGSQSNCIV